MQAKDWISKKGWTLSETLEALRKVDPSVDISVAQLSRLVNGKQWPSRSFVVAFAQLTKNKVDANVWAGIT